MSWPIFFVLFGTFEFTFFAWSARFVDATVATILWGSWPIIFVVPAQPDIQPQAGADQPLPEDHSLAGAADGFQPDRPGLRGPGTGKQTNRTGLDIGLVLDRVRLRHAQRSAHHSQHLLFLMGGGTWPQRPRR